MGNKINLNFKVDEQTKKLLDDLVVFKTLKDMKKSSQHAVLEEALITLLKKYNEEQNQ